jgi:hypothetical protein
MVPGVGDLLGAEDLQTAAQNNDWGGIGLGALAAIPGIPAIGRGVRGEARAARGVANTVADAVPTNQPMTEAESALARYRAAYPEATNARVLSPGDEGYPTNAQWDEASQAYVAPVEPDYPIRAFHGSPHSFDRFSLDKIGTGEGAQAYGHGLYFAESEDVARNYRDQLAGTQINGLDPSSPEAYAYQAIRDGTTPADALAAHRQYIAQNPGWDYPEATQVLEQWAKTGAPQFSSPGSMYEVGINADPNTFLDWDRPLSEQPEPVRQAYARAISRGDPLSAELLGNLSDPEAMRLAGLFPDSRGAQAYNTLASVEGQRPWENFSKDTMDSRASDRLREYGISGIRYLDGNSRGVGEGSSNYVVFNDDLVKILRKYGIGGLSTTVGASALAEELDRRGQTQEF